MPKADKSSRIMAIDPGLCGAIAYVERDARGKPAMVLIQDIMTREHAGMAVIDLDGMAQAVAGMPVPELVVFEEPIALYAQKGKLTTSARTIKVSLINYGRLQCFIEQVFGVTEWAAVPPITWKRSVGLSANKKVSLQLARLHYPFATDLLNRNRDHDRAEALLLAEYAHWYLYTKHLTPVV